MTHTRTHVFVTFANPYLTCDQCKQRANGFHDAAQCGCGVSGVGALEPCGHRAGATSVCPSWSPVGGCQCVAHLGYMPHPDQAGGSR